MGLLPGDDAFSALQNKAFRVEKALKSLGQRHGLKRHMWMIEFIVIGFRCEPSLPLRFRGCVRKHSMASCDLQFLELSIFSSSLAQGVCD